MLNNSSNAGNNNSKKFTNIRLTPTQYLIVEVLIARSRMGERFWTFPTAFKKALEDLETAGWVFTMHGNVEATLRAGFSDAGKARWLANKYEGPKKVEGSKKVRKEAKALRKQFGGKDFWKEA